jgi:hypothetical protein
MKVRATLLAIPLIVGSALAQSTPPAGQATPPAGQSTPPAAQTTPPAGQTGQTGQTGQAGQVSRPGQGGQSGATGAQSGSMTSTQQTPPAEMKTMTYKGVLVDLACGSATASAAPATTTSAAQTPATTPGTPASGASSADRASGDCAVTANSTQLGLKMDDGKVVKFDLVGNQRAQDGLKTNKGWMKNIAANKPVKVKVSGILQGDKLIASSIN